MYRRKKTDQEKTQENLRKREEREDMRNCKERCFTLKVQIVKHE